MNFEHTQDRRMLADSLDRFIAEQYGIVERDRIACSDAGFSHKHWAQLAEIGALGALFPEEFGGYGGTGFDVAVVFESLGKGLVVEPLLGALIVGRAIAQAGGPAETAHLKKGILVRRDSTGQRVERKVDFSGIIKGKQPDFEVLPNDIIFLPGSTVRTLGYGLLGTVPGTVQMSIPAGAVRGATR
mgnify:CR=1 FL=1